MRCSSFLLGTRKAVMGFKCNKGNLGEMLRDIFPLWGLCTSGIVLCMKMLLSKGFSSSWDNYLISTPSAQLILSGGCWKGNMIFKSFFQLYFVWFLLSTWRVTKLIFNSLVFCNQATIWLYRLLSDGRRDLGELSFQKLPSQKKIPKIAQVLPFKEFTGTNKPQSMMAIALRYP